MAARTPAPANASPAARAGGGARPGARLRDAIASWTTPARITGLATVSVILTVLLLAALVLAVQSARSSQDTVGHQAAPAILADREIAFALADMDAQAANWLLVGRRALGSTEADAGAAYYAARTTATADLESAASGSIGGADVRTRINTVLTGLTTYHGYALQAQLLADQGDARGALSQYRLATDLMHGTLLPQMASVTDTEIAALNDSYSAEGRASVVGLIGIPLLGIALVAWLALAQWFLFRRTHRLISPGLLAATIVAAALTVGATASLAGAASDLHGARQDAFDSALALTSARAAAYDANADKSRAVLDSFRAKGSVQSFRDRSQQIVDLQTSPDLAGYNSRLAQAVADAQAGKVTFGGYLGTALRNSSFDGERNALLLALSSFQAYQLDEQKLEMTGNHDDAAALATGSAHGQSNYDFRQMDVALQTAIAIDHAYLDAYVQSGDSRLSAWGWLPLAGAPLVALLAVAGFWPRFTEYTRS